LLLRRLILANYILPINRALAVQGYVMKLGVISTLGFSLVFTLTGCSTQPVSHFSEVEKATSDFCSRYNYVNEVGKEVKLTTYTIIVKETDDSGRDIETSKTVTCDA